MFFTQNNKLAEITASPIPIPSLFHVFASDEKRINPLRVIKWNGIVVHILFYRKQ